MFEHLLVPLDGSTLAEAVLPAARQIAEHFHSRVTLLHLIEQNPPEAIHGDRHLTNEDEACAYLGDVAQRAFPSDLTTESHVHTEAVDRVARSIVAHALELGSDLIVMCTHGQGGLRSWLYGSIAQQVTAQGSVPVLLVPPAEGGAPFQLTCGRILVPLDGNPDHARGLPVAAEMARSCEASLHLLMVIHRPETLSGVQAATARLLPGATAALLDFNEQAASAYLQEQTASLSGDVTIKTSVQRGEPASVIVDTARATQADLIVLGTHGKAGMDAFWEGSITPRISERVHVPLLLIPVREQST
jgi:nucleotide-binding universal stress UspA family protein